MLYTIQTSLLSFWRFWSGIFEPMPFGEYIAIIVLFVTVAVGVKTFCNLDIGQ